MNSWLSLNRKLLQSRRMSGLVHDGSRQRRGSLLVLCAIALFLGHDAASGQTSPHGPMSVACEDCHSATSWKEMAVPMKFDHGRTRFPLIAQHALVACRECHRELKFAQTKKRCAECHDDIHRGELGMSCDRCHTPGSWLIPDMVQRHTQTRFTLVGRHQTAPCQACHINQQKYEYVNVPIDCFSCHRVQYEATLVPSHRAAGFGTDCETCHLISAARWGGSFSHAQTAFPLTGAHLAQPCAQCHVGNKFRGTPAQCVACHQQQYTASKNPNHVAAGFPSDCVACHSTTAWQPAAFDHNVAAFKLTGAHASVPCAKCHTGGSYQATPTQCGSCHLQRFTATTNPNHVTGGFSTDCASCHTTSAWQPATFDHSKASFKLTGAHAAVPCTQCHTAGVPYQSTPTQCSGCHQQKYTSAVNPKHTAPSFSLDCASCHSTTAWRPSTFSHSATSFPLTGSHVSTPCASCHVNGVYRGTATLCSGCHLTKYTATTNPNHAAAGFPTDCQNCHTTTAWTPSTFNHELYFPIAAGTSHSPARWKVCADCHTIPTNFASFTCITCHTQTTTDGHHRQVTGYRYNSADCYRCHPKGRSN